MIRFLYIISICVAALCHFSILQAEEQIRVGNFSDFQGDDNLPREWSPLFFENIKRHTLYTPVRTDRGYVIKATSQNSSSGLIRKISIDPRKYPILEWSWKITNVYEKGNARKKEGDDYPARLYITFAYEPEKVNFLQKLKFETIKLFHGEYPPTSSLNYIWANKVEKGSMLPNPYTDRVMMIAVESGAAKAGRWVREKRNILEDYRKIFGENPPEISGVAIMTDSDNTGEAAQAWYGDIIFRSGETP